MFCPSCGKEIQPAWTFCPYCKAQIPKPVSTEVKYFSEPNPPKKPLSKPSGFAWKLLTGAVVLAIAVFSFLQWNSEQAKASAFAKTKTLLNDGFIDNSVLEKVTWGKVEEAKKAFAVYSHNKDAEAIKIADEILQRENGMKILVISKDLNSHKNDFEWLKKARDDIKSIPENCRYYQHAKQLTQQLSDVLDVVYLQKAKDSLKKLEVKDTWGNLAGISEKSKVAAEATEIREQLLELEKEARAIADYLARDQYGKALESIFLKQGMDVYVTLSGKNHEYLNLKYILWSRPLVMKFADEGKIVSTARTLGFKKVTFEGNYYSGSWTYDL